MQRQKEADLTSTWFGNKNEAENG